MSPIVVVFRNGQGEVFAGETLDYFREHGCTGKVPIDTLDGDSTLIYNEDIRRVTLLPLAKWTKTQEEHKKAEEEKAAAEVKRTENLAAAKEQAKAQVKKDEAAALKAKYEAWHSQSWWRKLGRKCPVELPAEG
jgi:hypothetical protein